MRILYAGELWEGSTALDRLRALERLGAKIVPFNTTPFESRFRLVRSLSHRLNTGPPLASLNRQLRSFILAQQPAPDIVYIDKGVWIRPETLSDVADRTKALLVHFTPDAALTSGYRSRHFVRAMGLYDLCVTTKVWEVPRYKAEGARRVMLTTQAFERSRFFPVPPDPALASDVAFVGVYKRGYAPPLRAASSLGVGLAIWGRGWRRYARTHTWASHAVRGDGIWGLDYPRALCSAAICLGLLSKLIPETSTTRTFEIPACGGFLLAERSDEHRAFFDEGREAEYFASHEEMQDKIRFYLAHDEKRRAIAEAGRARCLSSPYSNDDVMDRVLQEIQTVQRER